MVPPHVRALGRSRIVPPLALALVAGSVALAGCRGRAAPPKEEASTDEERAAFAVRDRYASSPDVTATAAWAWTSPQGPIFVMVDVESAVEGVVQAVADLWSVTDGTPRRVARSQVMPSVAAMRSLLFEDITGDGIPDFLAAIADSAEVEYPIFLPGAQANLIDEIEIAGTGYHFDTGDPNPPSVLRGPGGAACAVQLWATEPAPDSMPAGWRYLALLRGGQLERPSPVPPTCGS